MASTKTNRLPKRFLPYEAQAQTQGALRYGAQEAGLQSLFGDTTQTYQRQSSAQDAAAKSLLGTLASAGTGLNQVYSDAGLTPEVRAQYAQTPDGQRILASLARGQADIQQETIGAQAGRQYIQQRLADDYRSDVGKINSQGQAMATERGLYESSLLDQLIGDDRASRSKINADARAQQFTADQAVAAQQAAQSNALIGQGLLPAADGTLQPLPGGKADPDAPANKPKAKPKTKVTPLQQNQAATDFSKALGLANTLTAGEKKSKSLRRWVGQQILNGREGIEGDEIFDPKTGAPSIDPKTGTKRKTGSVPGIEAINNQPIVQAALDMAFDGHLSPTTVKLLHEMGYTIKGLPAVKTRKDLPKTPSGPLRPRSNAPSGTRGQVRPT